MLREVLFLLVFVANVESGKKAECSSDIRECPYAVGYEFGDAFAKGVVSERFDDVQVNPRAVGALCNNKNWAQLTEVCSTCPLRFELTSPPEVAGLWVCAHHMMTTQLNPNLDELTLADPDNGKEMHLVAMEASDSACENWKYTNDTPENLTNYITLAAAPPDVDVWCEPGVPMALAERRGSRHFVVAVSGGAEDLPPQPGHLYVWQSLNVVSYMVLKARIQAVVDLLAEGSAVKGKLLLDCSTHQTQEDYEPPSSHHRNSCPEPSLLDYGLCKYEAEQENRLCTTCPVVIYGRSDHGPDGELGCLYNSLSMPSRKHSTLEATLSLPSTQTVVYVESSARLSDEGCTAAAWSESHFRGNIVALEYPPQPTCSRTDLLAAAKSGGVVGLIFLGLSGRRRVVMHNISLPTGIFLSSNLRTYAQSEGEEVASGVYRVSVFMDRGEVPVPVAIPTVEEEDFPLGSDPPRIIAIGVFAIFSAVLMLKVNHLMERAVNLNSQGIPLGLASTTLALAVLVTVAALSFSLMYVSGEEAVGTASDQGEDAVELANERNRGNVNELTVAILFDTVRTSVRTFENFASEGLSELRALSARFYTAKNDSYAAFVEARDVVDIFQPSLLSWNGQFFTQNGFYSDTFRSSNLVTVVDGETIYDSNWGFSYGIGYRGTSYFQREFDPFKAIASMPLPNKWYPNLESVLDVSDQLSGGGTDPRNRQLGRIAITGYSTDPVASAPKMATISPLVIGSLSGIAVASRPLKALAEQLVLLTLNSRPFLEKAQIVLFQEDGLIVSAHKEDHYHFLEWTGDLPQRNSYELFSVFNTRSYAINALANKLISQYGGLSLESEHFSGGRRRIPGAQPDLRKLIRFEQRQYYNGPQSSVLMHLNFDGKVDDVSGNAWDVKPLDCAACFSDDSVAGSSLSFNGKQEVIIDQALTTRVPRVAETREGSGTWASSVPQYNATYGATDTVAYVYSAGSVPMYRDPFFYLEPFTLELFVNPRAGERKGFLFTEGSATDVPAFRLHADGRFEIYPSLRQRRGYGCFTRALDVPAEQWTHLVVSVSFRELTCSVYLNRVLADQDSLSSLLETFEFDYNSGLAIGTNFNGKIDELKVHNRSLTAEEVALLPATGGPSTLHVPEKQWVACMDSMDTGSWNKNILHALLVPYADLQRVAEDKSAELRALLAVQRKNTEKELDRDFSLTLFILLSPICFAVILFVYFNDKLTKPFATFAEELMRASVMDVDDIQSGEGKAGTLCLRELNVMHSAMYEMVANLQQFKKFMPLSLLEQLNSDSAAESDADSQQQQQHPATRTPSDNSSKTSTMDEAAATARAYAASLRDTLYTHRTHRAACLVSNIVGWHTRTLSTELLEHHGSYISACITEAKAYRGMLESCTGDRIMVSFNCTQQVAGYKLAACHTALRIQDAVKSLFELSIGISFGSVAVADTGTAQMRRMSILGASISWAYVLEREARRLLLGTLVSLGNDPSLEDRFRFTLIAPYSFPKLQTQNSERILVGVLVDVLSVGAEEWMYQLEQAREHNKSYNWNRAVRCAEQRKWAEAASALELVKDGDVPPNLVAELRVVIQERNAEPKKVTYH